MAVKSNWRGHEIEEIKGVWFYLDNSQRVDLNPSRSCGNCGGSPTKEDHDKCLGKLENVKNACCGHGNTEEAYVQFLNGSRIEGQDVIDYKNMVKK